MNFKYYDLDERIKTDSIETIFPCWEGSKETVCIFSPHDDDAIIGAGYAIKAALLNSAKVYIFIFCKGNAGYSKIDQKLTIEKIREEETKKSYSYIGIDEKNIIRFNYPDFSVIQNIGWYLNNGCEGSFKSIIQKLREIKATRLLLPNGYREHIDHTAVNTIGSFDAPQAGDPIVVDWAEPTRIKTVGQYPVWADLSPEDMLVNKRKDGLRANRIVSVDESIESSIRKGILAYESQGEIIKDMINSREQRRTKNGKYIEVYLLFDPRPKMDYEPYKTFTEEME